MNTDILTSQVYIIIFPYVDFDYYRSMYGDIKDPAQHYIENWEKFRYDPCRFFSTEYYCRSNLDVADANINPLFHYIMHGQKEGRLAQSPKDAQVDVHSWKIEDPELNYSGWELPLIFSDEKLAINPYSDTSSFIDTINTTHASGLILNRSSTDWLIYFSGRNENFSFINKSAKSNINILILRDKTHMYYCSNSNMPSIQKLEAYIDYLTGKRHGNTALIGQSYGGFCALYQSTQIRNSVCFAFSPQAFHPTHAPHNIFFQQGINKLEPQLTPNLVQKVLAAEGQARYVIVGVSEYYHLDSYYWGDLLSAGLLASTGNACVVVVDQHEHATLRYLDAEIFLPLVFRNFNLFMNKPQDAAKLLANSQFYYDKSNNTSSLL